MDLDFLSLMKDFCWGEILLENDNYFLAFMKDWCTLGGQNMGLKNVFQARKYHFDDASCNE